jgi:hypothetical protein
MSPRHIGLVAASQRLVDEELMEEEGLTAHTVVLTGYTGSSAGDRQHRPGRRDHQDLGQGGADHQADEPGGGGPGQPQDQCVVRPDPESTRLPDHFQDFSAA